MIIRIMNSGLVLTIILSTAILLGALPISNFAFADDDESKKVLTGAGPPPSKLGNIGDLYIDSSGTHFIFYNKINKSTWQNLGAFQGPVGPIGPVGAQGPKGDTGPVGAQGPKGDTGPVGAQGTPGNDGATGAQGPKGDTGSTGPQGTPGNDGATGAQGPKGDTGSTGPQGTPGIGGTLSFYVKRSSAEVIAPNMNDTIKVACDPGDSATGGGFGSFQSGANFFFNALVHDITTNVDRWVIKASNPTGSDVTVFAQEICAHVTH